MPYTHPIDFVWLYGTFALAALIVLSVTIYQFLRKAPGELWAGAFDAEQVKATAGMKPQEFAGWLGDTMALPFRVDPMDVDLGDVEAVKWPDGEAIEANVIRTIRHSDEPEFPEGLRAVGSVRQMALDSAGMARKVVIEIFNEGIAKPTPAPQAPPTAPLVEAHAILDTPDPPAPVAVKRRRANLKPPAKRKNKRRKS